jgi:hypothetical protein
MASQPGLRGGELPPAEAADASGLLRSLRLSLGALAAAAVQGACAFLMLANSAKALLGVSSVAVAGAAPFWHSDPVRIPLMTVAGIGATVSLYVVWNGWRLRNRPEAQWRRRPLSRSERGKIAVSLASSLLTWALILGELATHHRFHP